MSSRHVSSPHAGIGNPGMCTNCSTWDVLGERAVMKVTAAVATSDTESTDSKKEKQGKKKKKGCSTVASGRVHSLVFEIDCIYRLPLCIYPLDLCDRVPLVRVGTSHEAALRAGQQTFARGMLRLDAENYN